MRALVTGGAGFIGSHVVDALVERGDRVTVLDDLSSGIRANVNPGATLHVVDVRSADARRLVVDLRPEVLVHLAAQISVPDSVRDPVGDAGINLMGGLNVLLGAADVSARVVFASTGGALYGDASILPTPESYPPWPVSPYGVAKLAFEHYLHAFRAIHGLDYTALRYGNVYGPRQLPHGEAGVVAIFCLALAENRPLVINGDGRQTRDYIHVADVVRANLAVIDAGPACSGGHFNVGTGRQTDVNTVFRTLVKVLDDGRDHPEAHGPAVPEQRTSALDSTALTEATGWQPQVGLQEGLAETLRWFQDRPS